MLIIATVVSHLARLIRYIKLAVIKTISMLLKGIKYIIFCISKRRFSCKDKINILSASFDELRVLFGLVSACVVRNLDSLKPLN